MLNLSYLLPTTVLMSTIATCKTLGVRFKHPWAHKTKQNNDLEFASKGTSQ